MKYWIFQEPRERISIHVVKFSCREIRAQADAKLRAPPSITFWVGFPLITLINTLMRSVRMCEEKVMLGLTPSIRAVRKQSGFYILEIDSNIFCYCF